MNKAALIACLSILAGCLCDFTVAQELSYRLTLLGEVKASALGLSSPISNRNQLLPQARGESSTSAQLKMSYGILTVSASTVSQFDDVSKPDLRFKVRELFVDYSLTDHIQVSAGKKILKWGTGYAFNPTGVIEPGRDPADPGDRFGLNEGRPLVSLDAYLGDSTITVAYVKDVDRQGRKLLWGKNELALRFYTMLHGADISLIGHYRENEKPEFGVSAAYVVGKGLELHGEFLGKIGTEKLYHEITKTDQDTGILFVSYPYRQFEDESNKLYYHLLIGGQYTFSSGVNLTLEYFHNEEGLTEREWQQWIDFVNFQNDIQRAGFVTSNRKQLSRLNLLWSLDTFSPAGTMQDYLFARAYHEIRKWNFEMLYLSNLHDFSCVLVSTLGAKLARNFSGYIRSSAFIGGNGSEFGVLFTDYSVALGLKMHL